MRRWLLDRLILEPSCEPIEPDQGLQRVELSLGARRAELWLTEQTGAATLSPPSDSSASVVDTPQPLIVLKFPGTAGRAERIGMQPLNFWPERRGWVIGVNPPGYGVGLQRATLRDSAALNLAIDHWLGRNIPAAQRLIVGNSLGCVRALAFASAYGCDALLLRNPPALPQLLEVLARRRGAGWLGRVLAGGLGHEWDAIELASRVTVPLLLVQSQRDALVLPELQDQILDRYAGPKQKFTLVDCDHADPIPEGQAEAYRSAVIELMQQVQ